MKYIFAFIRGMVQGFTIPFIFLILIIATPFVWIGTILNYDLKSGNNLICDMWNDITYEMKDAISWL